MRTVTFRRTRHNVPEYLDELTAAQYEYYIGLAYVFGAGIIDIERAKVRWLSHLLGLKVDYTLLKAPLVKEIEAQADVINHFFVARQDGRGDTFSFDTPVNLLKEYNGYTGPGDWLRGVTFGQFVECLTVLETAAALSPAELTEAYNHVARLLYGIPDEDKIPTVLAFHAATLFLAVWRLVQTAPIDINGRKIDFRIIFQRSGDTKADDNSGWAGITFEVAKDGLFGTVKGVEATDFWDVLLYLYRCKFDYLEEKRKSI